MFAPSAIVAKLSYCAGSKSIRAAVKYSPAGVVFFSEPDFTSAPVVSVLSIDDGDVKAPEDWNELQNDTKILGFYNSHQVTTNIK